MKINLTYEQKFGLLIDRDTAMEANAGSGKTRVLTERYLDLIKNFQGDKPPLLPSEIAAITFTNKAASEMRKRISEGIDKLIGEMSPNDNSDHLENIRFELSNAEIFTFHTFYNNILRNYADLIGLPYDFGIISNIDERALIEETIENVLGNIDEDSEYLEQLYLFGPKTIQDIFIEYIRFGIRFPPMSYDDFQNMQLKEGLVHYHEVIRRYENIKESKDNNYKNFPEFTYWDEILENTPASVEELVVLFDRMHNDESKFTHGRSKFRTAVIKKDGKVENEIKFRPIDIDSNTYEKNIKVYELLNKAWDELIAKKKRIGKISHNDTMILADELLSNNPDVCNIIMNKYKEIMIDEFQDTSPDQVRILEPIISLFNTTATSTNRLFIVGDPKQSIYAFKGADVSIFIDFIKEISDYNTKHKSKTELQSTREKIPNDPNNDIYKGKIPLSVTYRCSPSVIDFTNQIFQGYMVSNQYSGVDYMPMVYGIKSDTDNNPGSVEFLLTEELPTKLSDNERPEYAKDIANSIKNILLSSEYKNFKGERYQPKDIAVIARDNKSLTEISKALTRNSIPNKIEGSKKYYTQREVYETIAYLRFLLNSSDNIALATVLTSYYHGMNNSDLVRIKLMSEKLVETYKHDMVNDTLFDRLIKFVELYPSTELKDEITNITYEKAKKAISLINKLIPLIHRIPTSEVISMLCRESQLYGYIGESSDPEKSIRNIEKLVKNARDIQLTDFFDMSKYIDALFLMSVKEEDEEEAEPRGDNVVRIMTVHKSKGLEFPVVIFSNRNKSRSNIEKTKPIVHNNKISALKEIRTLFQTDSEHKITVKNTNPAFIDLNIEKDKKSIEEDKRLAYVACTRAEERLIVHLSNRYKSETDFSYRCAEKYGFTELMLTKTPNEEDFVDNQSSHPYPPITEVYQVNKNINAYDSSIQDKGETSGFIDYHLTQDLTLRNGSELYDRAENSSADSLLSQPDHLQTDIKSESTTPDLSFLNQDIEDRLNNRIYFPTNLAHARNSVDDYIDKYILGYHEKEFLNNVLLGSEIQRHQNKKINPNISRYELNSTTPLASMSKINLPQVAWGSIIHVILENIQLFISNENPDIFERAKLEDWLNNRGIHILSENSDLPKEKLQNILQDNVQNILDTVKDIITHSEIDKKHILTGNKEKVLFKAMTKKKSSSYDILGGIVDLYYIDEDNKEITVYDWKIVSTKPQIAKLQRYENQILTYMYLIVNLQEIKDKGYKVIGKIVFVYFKQNSLYHKSPVDAKHKIEIVKLSHYENYKIESEFHKSVETIDKAYYHSQQINVLEY